MMVVIVNGAGNSYAASSMSHPSFFFSIIAPRPPPSEHICDALTGPEVHGAIELRPCLIEFEF